MDKKLVIVACILGATCVVLGAFGAHALKEQITVEAQQTFETGLRYQMYHALLLLFLGNNKTLFSIKTKRIVLYLVVFGVLFFSGSIYGLATNTLTAFNFKSIAFITPVGGFLLILSWILLIANLLKKELKKD
ncbi:DUF423 domain-containing protein [Aestuariivivens sp. NBU2969]|uniref:DUF423 domain-containing protein n=1 Tax=Aestuariivivens sp. NBU2969 TaxID=2873267 RepID=UPI001CBE301A|nr:DUF423 domain-containing protein [Aestuariivivens sp. NBU2969]